jgi:recombination protein RecR
MSEGFDPQALLAQALEMQQRLVDAQQQAAEETMEGAAGGGKVRVTVRGTGEVVAVRIDPSVVDPADVEMLEDLIVAALHDAAAGRPRLTGVYAGAVQDLIDELGRLPGIGPKSAQRIAFHLLQLPKEDALRLARAIAEAKDRVAFCTRCFNVAEGQLCAICLDSRRDASVVCVVEEPRDVVAIEKTQDYHGRYHVLQGALNPIEGIGPDQLRILELLRRLGEEDIAEVILCTNPNLEGDATAMYLTRQLRPLGIKVTRLASGLPVGGDLEYADELTLGRALEGRREVDA